MGTATERARARATPHPARANANAARGARPSRRAGQGPGQRQRLGGPHRPGARCRRAPDPRAGAVTTLSGRFSSRRRRMSAHGSSAARRERLLVVATVMLGTISTILSATIINVAFPALMRELAIGHDTLQWIATGFLAATTTTMLASAWLIESFGERATFVATLSLFMAASILGALSGNAPTLIAARILQGAAAGVLQPLAMVALFRVYPPNERGRAMGLFGFGIVLAPAIGPAIGGALVESFGWRSIFLLPLPFCVAGILIALKALAHAHGHPRRAFDAVGTLLLAAGLAALLNVPVVGHRAGWLSVPALGLAAAGVAIGIGFIAWERRTPSPLIALHLFEHRAFLGATLVAFAYGAGLFGSTYLIPVFVQDIASFTPSRAGYLLLPPGLALAVAIAFGGRLSDRLSPRRIIQAGLVLFALSSLLLAFADAATGFVVLAAWLVIGRVGLG